MDIGYAGRGQAWTWHLGPGAGPDYLDDQGHDWSRSGLGDLRRAEEVAVARPEEAVGTILGQVVRAHHPAGGGRVDERAGAGVVGDAVLEVYSAGSGSRSFSEPWLAASPAWPL